MGFIEEFFTLNYFEKNMFKRFLNINIFEMICKI